MAETINRGGAVDALVDDLLALSRVLVGLTARTLAALDTDVTLPQYRMLVVLAGRGPQRPVDLATELGLHPSTITRTSDRLVRRDLVQRHHAEHDRRTIRLGLTDAGKELIGEVMRRRAAELRELIEPYGPDLDLPRAVRAVVSATGEPSEAEWWRRWSESARLGSA
ncbi:DNA-binding transcriptional regulator, MarR family [Asanoa hainanensis]|uniref:DNA-binding transcriptional regulator, MarR family n=1 Tax=Asanoa hainanensis TaxID=560556 RepID=A0A239PEQ7_9ACTN|nr:MarR family transcriptional regulator [Asanoa hainanensis]SNT65520.1 DNA-binding transcriptional regulator, MarR family [Asanoa hainanensis]